MRSRWTLGPLRTLLRGVNERTRFMGGRSRSPAKLPSFDMRIYERRYELSRDLLAGEGLEIGSGANPQQLPPGVSCMYFDRLDSGQLSDLFGVTMDYPIAAMDQIPTLFPDGAQFLIAHNVLEHSASPIATLIEWMGYMRTGGLMVVSIPAMQYCPPDSARLVPPPEHLLDDYLMDDCEDAFESREHVYSFLLGWIEHIRSDESKADYARHCLSEAHRSGHDFHWHALDHDSAAFIIEAAALLSNRNIEMVRVGRAGDPTFPTFGESIFLFSVSHEPAPSNGHLDATRRRIAAYAERLRRDGDALLERLGRPSDPTHTR